MADIDIHRGWRVPDFERLLATDRFLDVGEDRRD
jgi:hypothetical protein